MERTVGAWDRLARTAFGTAVVLLALQRPRSTPWALLGLYGIHDLACAALAYDPLFALAGVSTVPGARNARRWPLLARLRRRRRRAVTLPGGRTVPIPAWLTEAKPWRAIRSAARR